MDDKVVYVGCPHCGAGWYGEILNISMEKVQDTPFIKVNSLTIQGMNPTDILKPIMCLNCGRDYTPVSGYMMNVETNQEFWDGTEGRVQLVDRWIAERIMSTCG